MPPLSPQSLNKECCVDFTNHFPYTVHKLQALIILSCQEILFSFKELHFAYLNMHITVWTTWVGLLEIHRTLITKKWKQKNIRFEIQCYKFWMLPKNSANNNLFDEFSRELVGSLILEGKKELENSATGTPLLVLNFKYLHDLSFAHYFSSHVKISLLQSREAYT